MSDKLYDFLNKLQRWLYALGVLYLALCKIWGLPFGKEINETIIAIGAFLAAILEVATGIYHKEQKEAAKDLYQGEE